MAKKLEHNPVRICDFLKCFTISAARLGEITDALLRSTVSDYRSFGLKPKMCCENPELEFVELIEKFK